jgi:hypothetical protein
MKRGLGLLWAAVLLFAGSTVGASAASAASTVPGAAMSVTGTWHLHTNDCFFGVCDYTLHLVQNGHGITGGPGSGISGRVRVPRIVINFTGASSEDDWTCAGWLDATHTHLHGHFTDGTGGSGFCRAVRTGP